MTSRRLARDPDLVKRLKALFGVPIRTLHVVRHPLDNITTMYLRGRYPILKLPLSKCISDFERLCAASNRLMTEMPDEVLLVKHEDLLSYPEETLTRVCGHLALPMIEDEFLVTRKTCYKWIREIATAENLPMYCFEFSLEERLFIKYTGEKI